MSDYQYDHQTVKGFIVSSIFWGVVGIMIGLWISIQMWKPELNIPPFFTFGRLRVVHTNGLAFGLGVGAIFGISYYIVMRLTNRPLLFPKLARFHLYLFNAAMLFPNFGFKRSASVNGNGWASSQVRPVR